MLSPLSRGWQYSARRLFPPNLLADVFSLSSCLGDVASSVPPTHCVSSARCVFDQRSHSKRYPRSSLPSGTHGCCFETHAIHITRPIKTRDAYAGASDCTYCATQKLRVGCTRPRLTSALKKPDPGPVKTSPLFLAKITLFRPLPRQQFLAFGNTQPLRTSTVKTLMILPRLCSTPWRHAHASHLPTCTRRRVYRGHRARSLATVLLFSSPSIGYQKPLPQHGRSSCPYLGTRVGPVLWGTASN